MQVIEVYGKKSCPQCDDLKRFLGEVAFKYVDLESEEGSEALNLVTSKGLRGIPVLNLNGELFSYTDAIDVLLEEGIV